MLFPKTLAVVGGVLTLISTVGFFAEVMILPWEPRALFCLNTLGLVVLGVAAFLSLVRRIERLDNKVEQAKKHLG